MERVGHPDAFLPNDVGKGFRITGSAEIGVFNQKLAEDVVGRPLQWLSDLTQDVRNALKAKVISQAGGDQDKSRRRVLKFDVGRGEAGVS